MQVRRKTIFCIKPALNRSLTCNPYRAATKNLNVPCTIENTTYVSDISRGEAGGGQFTSFVIKHDCLSPSLFCDPTALDPATGSPTCQTTKKVDDTCRFDAECDLVRGISFDLISYSPILRSNATQNNCASPSNKCAIPPQTPLRVAPWQWVAIALFFIVGEI